MDQGAQIFFFRLEASASGICLLLIPKQDKGASMVAKRYVWWGRDAQKSSLSSYEPMKTPKRVSIPAMDQGKALIGQT